MTLLKILRMRRVANDPTIVLDTDDIITAAVSDSVLLFGCSVVVVTVVLVISVVTGMGVVVVVVVVDVVDVLVVVNGSIVIGGGIVSPSEE